MIRQDWTGWDGTFIDLTPDGPSAIRLSRGVDGLGYSEETEVTNQSPTLDGQEYVGGTRDPRPCFWPVALGGPYGDWFETQRRFWATLKPGRYGVWGVTAPDGSRRELTCRFVPRAASVGHDPSQLRGPEVVGVNLVADDPWWKGPAIERHFLAEDSSLPFFSETSDAVLNIASSYTVDVAEIANPGDQDTWAVWLIHGPTPGWSVGVGSDVVSGAVTVPAGRFIVVDGDPNVRDVRWDDGTPISWWSLTSVRFGRIPAGARETLSVHTDGSGPIDVTIVPRYEKAY